jgi:hypothetical protein
LEGNRGCPKFEESYEAYKASFLGTMTAKEVIVIDLDGGQPCGNTASYAIQVRGHKAIENDMKCDALDSHLVGTLKDLYVEKEMSTYKRDTR